MENTVSRKPGWTTYGCLMVGALALVALCWFVSLGYMQTLRMAGL